MARFKIRQNEGLNDSREFGEKSSREKKKIIRNEEKEVDANLRQKDVPREREEEGK